MSPSIKQSDALLITAGAGMGVDSGLPDFRGKEGFWKAYPVIERLGLAFEEMANPRWFLSNPKLAWAFYGHRLNLYRQTHPHKGFDLLLDIAKQMKGGYGVITSNVDGHFHKAGFNENRIEEVHGSINHFQCSENCTDEIWEAPIDEIIIDPDKFEAETIPICPKCGAVARPNILMFGDWEWNGKRSETQDKNLQNWLRGLLKKGSKLTILEIGAGLAVPTIRITSEALAKQFKASFIRINPRDYQNNYGQSIAKGGLEGIKELIDF